MILSDRQPERQMILTDYQTDWLTDSERDAFNNCLTNHWIIMLVYKFRWIYLCRYIIKLNRGHIQFPVWGHCLWWGVYRGNIKDSGWKIQGTPKTTLSHACTHPTNWTYHNKQQLQHYWQGGPGAGQDHKRIYLHNGKQSKIKQEHW